MTLRSLLLVTGLACALAACDGLMKSDPAPAPPQEKRAPVDSQAQFEADIMAGRVEVMQDQTAHGLNVLGVPSPEKAEHPTDRDTYRRLYDAVERYNALNKSACAGGVVSASQCSGPPYLPLWYAGRARPDTSPEGMKSAAEDMQGRMMTLWDPVCAKAKAKTGDQDFCAIE